MNEPKLYELIVALEDGPALFSTGGFGVRAESIPPEGSRLTVAGDPRTYRVVERWIGPDEYAQILVRPI